MTKMTVVQWADVTGTGFSPQAGTSAPDEYWAAAETLLRGDLCQPPEGILATRRHPIWTLRRVSVARRPTWCFVVQGRRDTFGVAGTCRFAFAPEEFDAHQAWTQGMLATEQTRPEQPPRDRDLFDETLSRVLGGVVVRRPAIPIGTGPATAAAIIPYALGVLPERIARAWSWSTCMLQPPTPADRAVVSGFWPEEFREWEPDLARAVGHAFAAGPVTEREIKDHLGGPAEIKAFEQLVRRAAIGRLVEAELRHADLDPISMIMQAERSTRSIRREDVGSMLDTPDGRAELLEHNRGLISRWAADAPADALAHLQAEPDLDVVPELLDGLLKAQQQTAANLLDLPTAATPGPTRWHVQLAELLQQGYAPDELRALAKEWAGEDGVWADPDDAAAARKWLPSLNLDEHTAPELFPVRAGLIAAELNHYHRLTEVARDELRRSPQPLAIALQICTRLEVLPSPEVAALLRSVWVGQADADNRGLGTVAHELTKTRLREGGPGGAEWIEEVLEDLDDEVARWAMFGALKALIGYDRDGLDESLLLVCQRLGQGYESDAPSEVRALLEPSRRRNQATAAARVPVAAGSGFAPVSAPPAVLFDDVDPAPAPRPPARRKARTLVAISAVGLGTVAIVVTLLLIMPGRRESPPPAVQQSVTLSPVDLPAPADPAVDKQTEADVRALLSQLPGGPIRSLVLLTDPTSKLDRGSRIEAALKAQARFSDTKIRQFQGIEQGRSLGRGEMRVFVTSGP